MDERAKLPPYATHLPLLMACVQHTRGPIIELGTGTFSTPMLHALCAETGRTLLSLESDANWLAQFRHFATAWHRLLLVPDWSAADLSGTWDVALIDHAPPIRRVPDILRLRPLTKLIVIHDTENRCYRYEPLLTQFKHRVEWQRYSPWTSVVSDTEPLDWLKPICEV